MSTVVTTRILPDLKRELDKLAESTHRARSWLINEALRAYVSSNAWQIEAIEKGVQAAKEGKIVPGETVNNWLKTWGTPEEKTPPQWK